MTPSPVRWLAAVLAALVIAGCAAAPPVPPPAPAPADQGPPTAGAAVKEPEPSGLRLFPDRDLLDRGIALLQHPQKPEPERAREAFSALLKRYPQSRWRPAAEALIQLIDLSLAARESERKSQRLTEELMAERSRALQERELLKKQLQDLQARLQSETAALSQENEQLKKDLQRLKALEVELEKRERLLR